MFLAHFIAASCLAAAKHITIARTGKPNLLPTFAWISSKEGGRGGKGEASSGHVATSGNGYTSGNAYTNDYIDILLKAAWPLVHLPQPGGHSQGARARGPEPGSHSQGPTTRGQLGYKVLSVHLVLF